MLSGLRSRADKGAVLGFKGGLDLKLAMERSNSEPTPRNQEP